jgi:hypothetical protein
MSERRRDVLRSRRGSSRSDLAGDGPVKGRKRMEAVAAAPLGRGEGVWGGRKGESGVEGTG